MTKARPPLEMVRTLAGLSPATAYDSERLAEYGVGSNVEVNVRQRRSGRHHRLYWVVLGLCVANKENVYGSSDDLHRALKIALGYTRKIKLVTPSPRAEKVTIVLKVLERCDSIIARHWPGMDWLHKRIAEAVETVKEFAQDCVEITVAGSTAYDAMDQAEFRIYFDKAMEQLRLAGYPVDDYMSEATRQLAPVRAPKNVNVPTKPELVNVYQRPEAA